MRMTLHYSEGHVGKYSKDEDIALKVIWMCERAERQTQLGIFVLKVTCWRVLLMLVDGLVTDDADEVVGCVIIAFSLATVLFCSPNH